MKAAGRRPEHSGQNRDIGRILPELSTMCLEEGRTRHGHADCLTFATCFVNSTFRDMQAVRDLLRTTVFPELEERLRSASRPIRV